MLTRSTDGVRRETAASSICPQPIEPGNSERDYALERYYAAELVARRRPANDNRRTYRSVRSHQPRHCYNSTSFKYVDVALARVSILEGAAA